MRDMTKGSNASLSALSENVSSAIISLGWSSPTGEGDADVSVLLLDAGGKVRSDADFYFYNNPVAADGSVQLLGKEPTGDGSEDRISFDLTAVPADVERIVVAASRYEGARFGAWAAAGAAPSPASSAVSTTPCSGSTPPWWSTWTLRHPGVRRRRSGPRCESRAAVVIAGCAARRAHRRPRIAPNCPRSRCARSTSSSSNRRSGLSISSPHSSRIWRRR